MNCEDVLQFRFVLQGLRLGFTLALRRAVDSMILSGFMILILGTLGPVILIYFWLIRTSSDPRDQKEWLLGLVFAASITLIYAMI